MSCCGVWWILVGCVLLWCDVVLCYAVLNGRRNLTKNPSLKFSDKIRNWKFLLEATLSTCNVRRHHSACMDRLFSIVCCTEMKVAESRHWLTSHGELLDQRQKNLSIHEFFFLVCVFFCSFCTSAFSSRKIPGIKPLENFRKS